MAYIVPTVHPAAAIRGRPITDIIGADLAKGWLDGTIPNYGVMLKDADESILEGWVRFRSSDWDTSTGRPQLIVYYYDPIP